MVAALRLRDHIEPARGLPDPSAVGGHEFQLAVRAHRDALSRPLWCVAGSLNGLAGFREGEVAFRLRGEVRRRPCPRLRLRPAFPLAARPPVRPLPTPLPTRFPPRP